MQYDQVGNRIKDSYNGVASFINNAITKDQKEVHSYNTYAYDLDGLGNLTTIVNYHLLKMTTHFLPRIISMRLTDEWQRIFK